jgi:hypothetical protein
MSYPVPEQFIDDRDLMGNVRSLYGGNLQIGDNPVLVETARLSRTDPALPVL